jgi:hypothetical protein
MVYTYEKDGKVTAIEICSAITGKGFELRRKDATGREIVETFTSAEELNRRLMKIETDLLADGWFLGGAARTG